MGWKRGRGGEKGKKEKKGKSKSGKRMKMSTKGDLQSAAVTIITGKNNIKQLGLNFSIPVTERR